MKSIQPLGKSFENIDKLSKAFLKKYESFPSLETDDVIDLFTLMKMEKETDSELSSEFNRNALLCRVYIYILKGDIDSAIKILVDNSNFDITILQECLLILQRLSKYSLLKDVFNRFSDKLKDNLKYDDLITWFSFVGDHDALRKILMDMQKKKIEVDYASYVEVSIKELESMLENNQVPISEYVTIKKYMINVLENNKTFCVKENPITENFFIILMEVKGASKLISDMNSELSELLASDESLSLKLTGGFSSIIPSQESFIYEH